jgi:hypothetical protein
VDGEIFSEPVTGGDPTVLAALNGNNGRNPQGGLTLANGVLYATTNAGGALYNYGAVISEPTSGGAPTVLSSFDYLDGAYPQSHLVLYGDTLYGTTSMGGLGGNGGDGDVFSVPITGGPATILAYFNGTNGQNPSGDLVLANGTLYGTAGVVFSLPLAGGPLTALTSQIGFSSGLTLLGGRLYGTTGGDLYSVSAGGGPTTVVAYPGSTDNSPVNPLTTSGNTIYGTSGGIVYSVTIPPIAGVSSSAPTAYGSNSLGTVTLTRTNGLYNPASVSFSSYSAGFVKISGWSSPSDIEMIAFDVSDYYTSPLALDLSTLVGQINSGYYASINAVASTTDPTGGALTNVGSNHFNLFLTIMNPTLFGGSDYLGFDFSQLDSSGQLTVSAIAVTGIPEPAMASMLFVTGAGTLLRRQKRWRRN